ncbi:hypothetical protein [Salinilacihabitans rarus]|uniref:hypothetical protein n=1 Tax=Salinilacihabitans rarus TaxID=2961596 RepID=UPI0020C8BF01|nr:hypothetical protein [Salinilacihabitans rarus]
MSATRRAQQSDRPRYPDVEAAVGEDPARFLACSEHYLPLARIRGIQDKGLLSAYRAVEIREFGGREIVLEAIEERERELDAEGSR